MNRHAPYDRTCRVRYESFRFRPDDDLDRHVPQNVGQPPVPSPAIAFVQRNERRQRKEEQGGDGPIHHSRARPQSDEPRSSEQREERQHG